MVPATTMGFPCKYQVACIIHFLVSSCMLYALGYLVMISHCHAGFPRLTMVFPILAFPG